MADMIEGEECQYINRYSEDVFVSGSSSPTITRMKRDTTSGSYFEYPSTAMMTSPSERSSSANHKPFKNFSNFVFPSMGDRLASSKKSLTRSMTSVAKASHSFLSNDHRIGHRSKTSHKENNDTTDVDIDECDNMDENIDDNDYSMGSPIQRKDKIIRRIHSMYSTTKEKESFSMEDNSYLHKSGIKSFKVTNDLIPRIDENEMAKILSGKFDDAFDEYIIIDCRFNYEFAGGHINRAINISTKEELEEKFLIAPYNPNQKKQLLVFHCEFSSCRGPNLASHLRRCDRMLNSNNYPKLSYPDIVILAGGYRQFFDTHKEHCYPQGYVEMNDINYQDTCEFEMDKVRQANKLTRAKSYNHFSGDKSIPSLHSRSHSSSFSKTIPESSKVVKKQKSLTKGRSSTISSISKLESRLVKAAGYTQDSSIFNSPMTNSLIDDEFQPPSASFKSTHRRSISSSFHQNSSSFSINSSASSFTDTGFSSNDSLPDLHSSPSLEFNDFFDSKPNNLTSLLKTHSNTKNSLLNPLTRKPSLPVPPLPKSTTTQPAMEPSQPFKFPNSMNALKTKPSRQGLRISTPSRSSFSALLITSPTSPSINSTDFITGPLSSIIDPIDDLPADFSISTKNQKYSHCRRRSGSLLSSAGGSMFNLTSEDIVEGNEEQEEYKPPDFL